MKRMLMALMLMPMMALAGTIVMDGRTFTTGGDAEWYVDTTVSYDGVSSLCSGDIGHCDWSWLSLDVNENTDAILSFRWKVSTDWCDSLTLYIDDIQQAEIDDLNCAWGMQRVRLTAGPHTIEWIYSKDGEDDEDNLYYDDCGWVDTVSITTCSELAPVTYYVNASSGNDNNNGLSLSYAKATIQAAVDASSDGDTILVASGTYTAFSSWNKSIVILSAEGASKTFIDGKNADTCARLCANGDSDSELNHSRTTLEGFTLLNGFANIHTEGLCSAAYRGTVKKCVVRNCRGHGYYARYSSACNGCAVSDTLAYSNSCDHIFSNSEVFNCTVVDNQGCGLGNCTTWNTISWNNSSDVNSGTLNYCLTKESIKGGVGNIKGTPKFVDADKNDYRIRSWFPGVDAGDNAHVTNTTDLAGNTRIACDFVDIGCYEYAANDILYVNQATGSDSNSGRTKLASKATIQAAIDVANDGDTIVVADGTYDAIEVPGWRGIVIRSMNGAAKTIIDGKNSKTVANLNVNGANHNKGACVNAVVGFTLQNGSAYGYRFGGGALCDGLAVNCLICNNYASGYGGGSVSSGASQLINCIIYNNEFGPDSGGIVSNCALFNCTLYNNLASYGLWDCHVYNSISYNSGSEYRSYSCDNTYHNSLTKRGLDSALGNITGDPLFMNDSDAYPRLTMSSPCVNTGNMDCYSTWLEDSGYEIPSEYFETDFFGNPRVSGAQVDMGAVEKVIRDDGGPYTEVRDGVEWTFYVYNGLAEIGNGSTAIPTSTAGRVAVPDELGGHTVVSISQYAFSGCSSITNIVIASPVSNVYKRAFNGCSALRDVEFPASLAYLDNSVFRYLGNVTNITFAGNAPYVDDTVFKYPSPDFTVTVNWGTTGWDDDGDGYWMKERLIYLNGPYCYLSLNANGGNCASNLLTVSKGEPIGHLPVAERTDNMFLGWFTDVNDGDMATSNSVFTSNATLYAHWKPIVQYRVCFNANGGTVGIASQNVTNNTAIGELPTAERDGHKFLGWFTEKDEGTQITSETIIMNNVTFYAHWFDTSIGNVTGATNVLWRTGGDAVWATEETDDGWDVRSGAIGKNSETWVECVVTNGCRVAFYWKASCEPDDEGEMYDYLSFAIDGEDVAAICGETDWTNGVFTVAGEGEHGLRWTYQKDYRTSEGEDCGWLRKVKVDPEIPVTFEDNGATSGEIPTITTAYLGDTITIPGTGTLAKSCHTFGGWQYGGKTYSEGETLKVETNAVEFVAVWNAKVLSAVTLQTPETQYVTTEKIGISFNMPENATTICYTLDGSEPTIDSPIYEGAFEVESKSVTVKAIAYADDWFDSACATWELTRAPWSAPECLNVESRRFTFGGNSDWVRDLDVTHDGEAAMRNGAIGDKRKSLISMSVNGAGSVSFWYKVSSECDQDDGTVYDGLAILVDGVEIYDDLIGGEVDWTNITVEVAGEGEHAIGWRYEKDKTGKSGEDCVWLDEILWQADETVVTASETGSKDVVIGREWIEQDLVERYGAGKTESFRNKYGTDYDLAVRKLSGKMVNGKSASVWHDYVAGTDPTDTNSVFTSSIEVVDGIPNITWNPDLETERTYKIWGSTNLVNGGDWEYPTNALHRFFKVTVEMP